jgi:hypothetical protein
MKSSELCATCHTLLTQAYDDQGNEVGSLPEQVPYFEWLASDFRDSQSCQSCHMPVVQADNAISSVLGQPRPEFNQHVFRGGNAFVLSLLNKYRDELGVQALPQELDAEIRRTRQFLGQDTARLDLEPVSRRGNELAFDVVIDSLTGHKLPTAYPARRVWLHVTVKDGNDRVLFESGAVRPDGSIVGNDNDEDAARFEPHYEEITRADQVQIFESILVDWQGRVTTGLLYGVTYAKDNRILPRGFDKATAEEDVAVHGAARNDASFVGGGDRVRYRLPISGNGAVTVSAELLYQSIGYRWADNLSNYSNREAERFLGYYRDTISGSAVTVASDEISMD